MSAPSVRRNTRSQNHAHRTQASRASSALAIDDVDVVQQEEGEDEIDPASEAEHSSQAEDEDGPAVLDSSQSPTAGPGPQTLKRRRGRHSEDSHTPKKHARFSSRLKTQQSSPNSGRRGPNVEPKEVAVGQERRDADSIGIGEVDWLIIGDEFPWDRIDFYFDASVGDDMIAHLTKRIKKVKGKITSTITQADIILINPHPARLSADRLNLLSSLDQVQVNDCLILSYHWLSRCYFSRRVEGWISDVPVFVQSRGNLSGSGLGMKVAVGRLGEGLEGDKLRRKVMEDLETNGAMIVPNEEATTCILPSNHPMLIHPPSDGPWAKCVLNPPEWVQQSISKAKEQERRAIKPSDVLRMSTVKVKSVGAGKKRSAKPGPTQKHTIELKPPRSAHRTEFIAYDRDMLARWLAFKRPEKTGRTTRSIYEELAAYSSKHPIYAWASRHTAAAWHEHFKRNRNRVGNDGKILEDEVERYVSRGVDSTLKTLKERSGPKGKGEGKGCPAATAATTNSSSGRPGRGGSADKRKRDVGESRRTSRISNGDSERGEGRLSFSKDASQSGDDHLEVLHHDIERPQKKKKKTVHYETDDQDGTRNNDNHTTEDEHNDDNGDCHEHNDNDATSLPSHDTRDDGMSNPDQDINDSDSELVNEIKDRGERVG
ncbi:hypothetical protein IAU59_003006 [Kwoniella sp. CBS 9459]